MSVGINILINTAPLFITAIGALLSEMSGKLNIGLEGAILFGAFLGATVFSILPFSGIALLAGLAAGLLCGAITAILSVRAGANIFIVGLGINLLSWGSIPLFSQLFIGKKGIINLNISSSAQMDIAVLGLILAILLAGILWIALNNTDQGLRLSKIYLDEETAKLQGTDIELYQIWSLILSSGLAGLSGAIIALHLGSYVPNLSAGKGWIALVIIYLGNRKLGPMAGAAIFFALSQHLAIEAQRFFNTPGLLLGLPFILTLLALIMYRLIQKAFVRKSQNLKSNL